MSMTDTTDATLYLQRERDRDEAQAARLSRISRRTTGRLRRSTLVLLRWTAIAGQVFALIIVAQVLGFQVPVWPCIFVIGLSALINLGVGAAFPLDRRVGDMEAAAQLGFDSLQLAVLLWLTGGMTNPFALLFLAPVVTGATTLSRPVLGSLGLLAAGLSYILIFQHQPLPWVPEETFAPPFIFTLGAWIALMVGMVFTSLYAWRAATEARRMSEALAATEAVLAHEQKLAALGGLAAAAAHELGTPLATIQVTAKEMARELKADTPLGEDARLLVSQTQRCREILKQLGRRGDEGDVVHDSPTLRALLEEAIAPFDDFGPLIDIETGGEGPEPKIRRQSELLYGLKNFIENAADFAESEVTLTGFWSDDILEIIIEDDGPGFDPVIKPRLGEPYVSGRSEKTKAGGLGLGFFIAKTLIERTGGRVKFGNATGGGAQVKLIWPRAAISYVE